jgi:hypothetical protein
VFLKPMQDSMGWTAPRLGCAWMWVAYGTGSLMWGMLADRWAPARGAAPAQARLGLGLVISRIPRSGALPRSGPWSVAAGAFTRHDDPAPWFAAKRGLAVALVSGTASARSWWRRSRWLIGAPTCIAMLIPQRYGCNRHHPLGLLVRRAG